MNYSVEEYFGIDIQINVEDFEFQIPSVWLDSPMPSPIFYDKKFKLKLKIPSKFITIKILVSSK